MERPRQLARLARTHRSAEATTIAAPVACTLRMGARTRSASPLFVAPKLTPRRRFEPDAHIAPRPPFPRTAVFGAVPVRAPRMPRSGSGAGPAPPGRSWGRARPAPIRATPHILPDDEPHHRITAISLPPSGELRAHSAREYSIRVHERRGMDRVHSDSPPREFFSQIGGEEDPGWPALGVGPAPGIVLSEHRIIEVDRRLRVPTRRSRCGKPERTG